MSKSIILNPEVLKKLYLDEKLDSYKIAHILNCSPSHVRDSLRENSIKSRSVQEAKALTPPKYARKNFDGSLADKAYLIGFRLGDLYISKTHPNSPTIRISCNTTKKEQLDLIHKLFAKYGHVRHYNRDKRGAINTRCFVNNSFSFLLEKEDRIENWILENKRYFLSFLAGYADAEGSFCICGNDGVFSLKVQDKNILFSIHNGLDKLGILCKPPGMFRPAGHIDKRGIKNNRDVWILTIYRKNSLLSLIKLLKPILKHRKRIGDMLMVEKNIKERNLKYNNLEDRRWYKTYPNFHEWPQ